MKKPLQDKNQEFYISSKGRLIRWGKNDVKNLLNSANNAIKKDLASKKELTLKEAECLLTKEWFDQISEKGINKKLIDKINSRIAHVNYRHVLIKSSNEETYWRYIANGDQIDDPELSIAYGVAHLLENGSLKGLKKCKYEECKCFFIGKTNQKWCSEKCGTSFRVKKMRRKNKR